MECWVGFSYHDNWLSNLMRQKMNKPYSHVFMLFECNNQLLVLQATRVGVAALGYDAFKAKKKIIGLKKITNLIQADAAFDYCIKKLGTPYGFLAIIAIGLGIHYEDGEKTLICSEYVSRALGIDPEKLPDLITPADVEAAIGGF